MGHTPIPHSPMAATHNINQLPGLTYEREIGRKLLKPFANQESDSSHSRVLRTAAKTVEKGKVAYQKYAQGLKSHPM